MQKSIQVKTIIDEASKDQNLLNDTNKKIRNSADVLSKTQKLIESMKELETELFTGEYDYYRVISELLIDVQHQISYFDIYTSTPYIIKIRNKLNSIENELKRQIQWNFREIGQLVPTSDVADENPGTSSNNTVESSIDINTLKQVYLVIDALGIDFRKDLLERFSQLQLIPYEVSIYMCIYMYSVCIYARLHMCILYSIVYTSLFMCL